jgi:WD40 repeat protein
MAPTASSYDLFLSYNSEDHDVVEAIARKLRDEGLEPFLDRWYLAPGARWRSKLEDTLSSCKDVAIFVGPAEMGSWQQREVDVALDLQSRNPNLPVIPVLLPGCEPPLGFLRQLTWVDLRSEVLDRGIAILIKAARGEAPGPDLQRHFDFVRASICPYRGLLHFREEDAPFFFGREAAIEGLVEAIKHHPFLALVGASGSGKSSVVRAGLVPRLRSDRGTTWEFISLIPTDQPLKALAMALVPFLEPTKSEVDRLEGAGKLAGLFADGTVSLYDVVRRILDKQRGTDRVLIFIDQFEELYTLVQDDAGRRKFVDELITASTLSGSKLTVAITLRGDFVGKAFAYRALSDRLQGAQINLGPMTRQELTSVIRKPAEKLQLNFEAGLVERILDAVGDEPGNLPLLEFVLTELWEKRRGGLLLNESYDTMGELKGALAKKADDFFAHLSPAERNILQRVFLRLVSPADGGEDTRRRAAFTELPLGAIDLVDKLAKERLLVTNVSSTVAAQTVEVAHEALISNWVTLRAWVNEDREFLFWRKRLEGLLREWEGVGKDEGALLRGPLLIEAQSWFDKRSQDLSEEERSFINASRALRELLDGEEKKRQKKELEDAEKRAKEQKEAASKLRRLAWLLALVALAAAAAAIFGFWQKRQAEKQTVLAREAEHKTAVAGSRANVSLAQYLLGDGEHVLALVHLAQALRLDPSNERAGALTGAMLTQANWPVPVTGPMRHDEAVFSVQFSADGQRVVTASFDKTARVWDAATGKAIGEPMRHEDAVYSAQFSADGQRVVTASLDKTARVWDAATGKAIGEPMRHEDAVRSAQFSADGQRVVTASLDKTARVWDAATGKAIGEPMRHEDAVYSAQFSADGQRVVTASLDKTAQVWDAATGKAIGEPMRHGDAVLSAQFSADGQRVVTASKDKTARVWDAVTGKAIGEPMRHQDAVRSARFSPDGQRVVTASEDKTARVWDAATGKAIGEPMRHQDAVISAQFSPDDQRVVSASFDKTARVWDAATGKAIGEPMRHDGWVYSAQFSADGQRVVTASRDNTARVWDAAIARAIEEPMRHGDWVYSAQFSADGQRVVSASKDKTARVWDAATGKAIGEPMRHEDAVISAQFSADGQRVVTASEDKTAQVWDAATGKAIGEPMRHEDAVVSAQFSADGQRVVTASKDKTARVWDAATGKAIGEPMRHGGWVYSAQFSADGQRVVTASEDKTARVWDAATGKAIGEPIRHEDAVISAQFSADGQRVVTASLDKTAQVWNAATGQAIGEPMRHDGWVYSAQFSTDGQWVVTASKDKTARVWDAAAGKAIGEPMRHGNAVRSAQFSADGQRVVTASWDKTARVWDAATGKAIGEPMRHEDAVNSAQFSANGQRMVTASLDKTAQVWDVPAIGNQDTSDDVLLLADLAEAACGSVLQTSGQAETLKPFPPDQVSATRQKIAAKFERKTTGLTPIERLLKWSVADPRRRTISPFSQLTVPEWIENRIKEGTFDSFRAAMQVDPANALLIAHFGLALAKLAVTETTDPNDARRARAEADYQTHRAVKLASDNAEVRNLRTEVVQLLNLAFE